MNRMNLFTKWLLRAQGFYFFITAVWPLVHISSFMYVTGPKVDIWLVKTVAVLILAASIPMLLASFRRHLQPDVVLLAMCSAIGLGIIDVYYATNDVIWDVYLLDAAAESCILIAWIFALKMQKKICFISLPENEDNLKINLALIIRMLPE